MAGSFLSWVAARYAFSERFPVLPLKQLPFSHPPIIFTSLSYFIYFYCTYYHLKPSYFCVYTCLFSGCLTSLHMEWYWGLCLFCSLLYLQWCLAHIRCSVHVCWLNKWRWLLTTALLASQGDWDNLIRWYMLWMFCGASPSMRSANSLPVFSEHASEPWGYETKERHGDRGAQPGAWESQERGGEGHGACLMGTIVGIWKNCQDCPHSRPI